MNELTAALKEELNVDTAFTLPIFGGIDIPESIAVSWGIMGVFGDRFDFAHTQSQGQSYQQAPGHPGNRCGNHG